MHVQSGLSWNT